MSSFIRNNDRDFACLINGGKVRWFGSKKNSRNSDDDDEAVIEESSSEDEEMISIKDIVIPREKITTNFARSSGPGGQNVNKTNSKAEIRFNVDTADWLDQNVKKKFRVLHKNHINNIGEVVITSQVGRSQTQNLEDAFERLRTMIYHASIPEKERTNKIPAETKRREFRRIDSKRKRSDVKRTRQGSRDY
jgi:peptidyl-tRNA hydrolase ICT1